MSTVLQEIDRGTVAQVSGYGEKGGIDPRRRRFCYAPGLWRMEVDPRESGRQERLLPQGILMRFDSAPMKVENYDIEADSYAPNKTQEFEAAWFVRNVMTKFEEYGLRECSMLTLLDDPPAGEVSLPHQYFNVIHPSFASLNYECPFGLKVCSTCRLMWLGADENSEQAAWMQDRMIDSGLDTDILEALRQVCINSNQIYQEFCVTRWAEVMGELETGRTTGQGLKALREGEHHVRRHIHEAAPEERAANAIQANQEAQAQATIQGMREIAQEMRPQPIDLAALKQEILNDPELKASLLAELREKDAEKPQRRTK